MVKSKEKMIENMKIGILQKTKRGAELWYLCNKKFERLNLKKSFGLKIFFRSPDEIFDHIKMYKQRSLLLSLTLNNLAIITTEYILVEGHKLQEASRH